MFTISTKYRIIKTSRKILQTLPEDQHDPLQLRPARGLSIQATRHYRIDDRAHHGFCVHPELFGTFQPVSLKVTSSVDPVLQPLVVEVKGVASDEEFIHDDA